MPIYTYRCNRCDHVFEKMLKMDNRADPLSQPCPNCGDVGDINMLINARMAIVPEHALGRIRPHRDWQEHLNRIKRNNPGSDFTTW